MTSSPDLLAAPSSERYQLGRLLGQGGFGDVHEAWDPALQRRVAIKRLRPDLVPGQPDNLLREARLAASLRHPAFVQIHALEDDGHTQSIVMELVPGTTLRELLATTRLTQDQVLDIVGQLADAMAQAHAAGLVHGDLKPANLMIEPSGQLRIMDFGLARRIDPLATETGDVLQTQGTIAYLAPEILSGKPLSPLGDIYAVGVMMYEMMQGERPFAHLNGLALAAAQMQSTCEQWTFAADADQDMAALVRLMCAPDPSKRTPTMLAAYHATQAIRQKNNTANDRTSLSISRTLPSSHLIRKRYVLAAISILAAVGLLIYSWTPTSFVEESPPPISDALRMSQGLAALRHFDRETSLDTAIENFEEILKKQPEHAAAAAGMALSYALRYAGDRSDSSWLERATASAQYALALNDQLALAYAAQAFVTSQKEEHEQGLQFAQKALQLDPLNIFALNIRNGALIYMQRDSEAEQSILAARKIYPKERLFADQLGELRVRQGNYAEAERIFRHSIQLEPDAVYAYANLSAVLQRMGQNDEALQVLQQGLQLRPSGILYTNLGNALFNRGDYVGAAKAFQHAVSTVRGNRISYLRWANLADTLRWIPGREEDSRTAYRNAAILIRPLIERAPKDATLMSRMGLYSAKLGDENTAAQMTKKAVAANPSNPDIRFRAAIAYEIIGKRDAALAELINAQQLGYPTKLISTEPDLLSLRSDPRLDLLRMERKQ